MANITCEEMRNLCIKHNWFSCGTNTQYDKLFEAVRNERPMDEVSTIIWLCSEGEWTKERISEELRRFILTESSDMEEVDEYFRAVEADMRDGKKLNRGKRDAYDCWRNTLRCGSDMFDAAELPWGSALAEGAMEDFINTLREAGVKTFAVTSQSTSLMEGLHAIFSAGCTFIGPVIVKRRSEYFGGDDRCGLGFRIRE